VNDFNISYYHLQNMMEMQAGNFFILPNRFQEFIDFLKLTGFDWFSKNEKIN